MSIFGKTDVYLHLTKVSKYNRKSYLTNKILLDDILRTMSLRHIFKTHLGGVSKTWSPSDHTLLVLY